MKGFSVALTAILAVAWSGAANSADLRYRSRPARAAPSDFSPVPVSTWSGLYVGLNGGGGWGTTSHGATGAVAGALAGSTGDFDVSGGLFGGTAGYNWQVGTWVYGGEADLDWAHINGSKTFLGVLGAGPAIGTFSTTLDWLDTVRARVGFTNGPALFYVTGGAAYGSINANISGAAGLGGNGVSIGQSDTRLGWTLGGGVEYMFAPRWTGKLEYLYVDLGTNTQVLVDNVKFNTNILRGGVNWHF